MDLEPAEPASSRRTLIGAAGLVGAAAALLRASSAAAAPIVPSEADRVGLVEAMRLELTARDLYEISAGTLSGDDAVLAGVVAANHRAYAQAIAGATGNSANENNSEVFAALEPLFNTSDGQAFAAAARDLENTAVATHTALLGQYDGLRAIELTASIIAIEARQAAVFTSMAGFGADLDQMLNPETTALPIGEAS